MASERAPGRSLTDYMILIQRYWVLILITTIIAGISGYAAFGLRQPQYQAVARVYVVTSVARPSIDDLAAANQLAQSTVVSFAQVATSPLVLNPVIKELGLPYDAASLQSRMSVSVVPNTVVMVIGITDDSPVVAAKLANAIATQLGDVGPSLGGGSSTGAQVAKVTVSLLQPAAADTNPVGPGASTFVGVAVLVAFVLLTVLIAVLESIRSDRFGARRPRL